uniref:Uncharacterized protein n=1 Tax=Haptolina ericina TaxID=156174 RepID=A0A7S3B333_9EUKA|mmetsp:Transcript_44935/g.101472  ORF Transcript_44935/g.101472 Transcript_44935/m.101472 type:complete len:148 (+) Transcript_44935:308-751(+)
MSAVVLTGVVIVICRRELPFDADAFDPGRHRCVAEQGVSKFVVAHISVLKEAAKAAQGQGLPENIARADTRRPKLIDLSGSRTQEVSVTTPPEELVKKTIADLKAANFTSKGDHEKVKVQLEAFELSIRQEASSTNGESPVKGKGGQ